MSEQERILQNMRDAGCAEKEIDRVGKMLKSGREDEVLHCLKRCRCTLIEELHRSQRRVDCLDHLIREREKRSL